MTIDWSLAEVAARLLERDEREAVLGDLLEAHESGWQGLLAVLGLAMRRQTFLWKSWRPWLAAFGLALPSSLLLMGISVSVSANFQQFTRPKSPDGALTALMCQVFLLIAWAWTGGFVVGSVSRGTLWASIAAGCAPCLFCLARFRIESLSRLSLLLFLLPAVLGVRQGVRLMRVKRGTAIIAAAAITMSMILAAMIQGWTGKGFWILNGALIWPAWYMVATARSPGSAGGRRQ